jgi:hypothetical protein
MLMHRIACIASKPAPTVSSRPKLPQARLELRRQPIQHLAAGRGLDHGLSGFLSLGMNRLDTPTHSLRALRLMRRGVAAGAALDMGITNKAFDSYEQGLIRDAIAARIPAQLTAAKLFD